MSTEISLKGDKVVVKWKGKKGEGSMLQLAAEHNAPLVNQLSAKEIVAVLFSVKAMPFAMGNEAKIYKMVMERIDGGFLATALEMAKKTKLGDLRKSLVVACGEGSGAPHDTYLQVAVDCQEKKPEAPEAKLFKDDASLPTPVTSNDQSSQTAQNDQGEARGDDLRESGEG